MPPYEAGAVAAFPTLPDPRFPGPQDDARGAAVPFHEVATQPWVAKTVQSVL
ncbi:MAG: hypothetical protein M3Q16_00255 [Pseudomonadota bacterium]|nr:hypothetical protein [Pseudomonadota bacterium]